jgi:D-glycero-beta-D-manno-heptose-7-phosphate kinase
VIANKHQLLRLDTETTDELENSDNQTYISKIKNIINEQKIDAVVFEDYDKGGLNKTLIEEIIALTKTKNIPTTVDPKKRNFEYYNGATLFKPNLRELHDGIGFKGSKQELINNIETIGKNYCTQHNYNYLFTTLSEHGVFICDEKATYKEAAHLRSIADVSGAGDTVIAVATLCLALGLQMQVIAQLSNTAGGLVCEKVGVVPIDKNELLREIENLN